MRLVKLHDSIGGGKRGDRPRFVATRDSSTLIYSTDALAEDMQPSVDRLAQPVARVS